MTVSELIIALQILPDRYSSLPVVLEMSLRSNVTGDEWTPRAPAGHITVEDERRVLVQI